MENTVKAKPEFNYAGTSLVLGIIGFFIPLLGLIPSVAGAILANKTTKAIKHTNEKEYYIAIAGLVCSIIAIGATILEFIGVWVFI